jgi:integrase
LATCDNSTIGQRDRALLLIGFTGAMRAAELAALRVEDVNSDAHGLRIRIRGNNNDNREASNGIVLFRANDALICPQRAFQAWHAIVRRKTGPLFVAINSNNPADVVPLTTDEIQQIICSRGGLFGLQFKRPDRLTAVGLRFSQISSV